MTEAMVELYVDSILVVPMRYVFMYILYTIDSNTKMIPS